MACENDWNLPQIMPWQVGRSLGASLQFMLEKNLWADIKFRCKDQDESNKADRISAHKIILAARSPVFQAMFYGPCADKEEEIILSDTDSEPFKLFLSFLYTDKMKLTEETVQSVMQIGHKYQVSTLLAYCSSFLASMIKVDNACAILELARFFGEKQLEDGVTNFIDDNGEKILKTEGFNELQLWTLEYILRGDTLLAKERSIFSAAMKWAFTTCRAKSLERSGPNLRMELGDAFRQLRLPTMKVEDFSRLTYKKGYLSYEELEETLSYITGNPLAKPYHVTRPRRKRVGDIHPKTTAPKERLEFNHYVNVTTKVSLKSKDSLVLKGLAMSGSVRSPTVPQYVNPKGKYSCAITFIRTVDSEAVLYPKMYFSCVKTCKQQYLTFEQRIEMRKGEEMVVVVHIMSYPSQMVYIPELLPEGKVSNADNDEDEEIDSVEKPDDTGPGLQVLEAAFTDKLRLIDFVRYECPSNR